MVNGSLETLSLATQIAGLGVAFVIGLVTPARSNHIGPAVGIGILANIVGQLAIAGGGPGAFVGFFVLPLFCVICWLVGKFFRIVVSAVVGGRREKG